MNAQKFFSWIEEVVKARFASGDTSEESPKVFVFGGEEGEESVVMGVPNAVFARALIGSLLQRDDVVSVGFVDEAWVAIQAVGESGPGEPGYVRPSEHPNRKEAVIMSYYVRGAEPTLASVEIKNEDGKRKLGDFQVMKGTFGGRLIDGLGGNQTQH